MAPPREVKYIAAGFRADADALLQKFIDTKSFQFSVFSHIWRASNFSLIFMGRENQKELKEFTEECFSITLTYFSPIVSLRLKTGAIYLLYGLYLKQPLETKSKIRIQIDQWKEIKNLLELGKAGKHHSLCFVIHKMIHLSAFNFVAYPKLMGPRASVAGEPQYETRNNKLEDLKSSLKEFLEDGDLEELQNIHEQYENMKQNLDSSSAAFVSYATDNQFDAVYNDLKELVQNDRLRTPSFKPTSEKTEDIGVRRAELKSKQFQKTATIGRSKRHNDLSADDENEDMAMEESVIPEKSTKKPNVWVKKTRKRQKKKKQLGRPRKYPRPEEEEEEEEEEADDPVYIPESKAGTSTEQFTGIRRRAEKARKTKYHFPHDNETVKLELYDGSSD